jgi:hypothetical protein
MNPAKKADAKQSEAFAKAARDLGCDEDEPHFDEKLKKVARHKPSAPLVAPVAADAKGRKAT